MRNKSNIAYVITVLFSVFILLWGNRYFVPKVVIWSNPDKNITCKAEIIEITDQKSESIALDGSTDMKTHTTIFLARIAGGNYNNQIVEAKQTIDNFTPYVAEKIAVGQKVLLEHLPESLSNGSMDTGWDFSQYVRTDKLLLLGILFMVFLVIFGRMKGVNTIVSLGFTCLSIFAIFIPSILAGANSYVMSVLICIYTIVMTLVIVNGVDRKTLAAVVGCISGVAVVSLLTLVMRHCLDLTGVVDEQSIYLTYLETENPIDLLGIIFAAIIIGAMGALMDVAMSIASSLWEIRAQVEAVTARSLWRSGITIGRDMMGTMANTLVLAYIGSSLSAVLLLVVYNPTILSLLNRELVVVEILQSLIGSMGLLFTIPFTSLCAAYIYTRGGKPTPCAQEEELEKMDPAVEAITVYEDDRQAWFLEKRQEYKTRMEKIWLEKERAEEILMLKEKNTIIFDLDGTLLDTLDDLEDSVNYALEQACLPRRTREEVRRFVGNGVELLIRRALPKGTEEETALQCLHCFKEHYAGNMKNKTKPYKGILELLEKLKENGYKMAVVSNKFDTAVKALVAESFGQFITCAIGEREGIAKKPAPDSVLEALKELEAKAEEAVYIGDSDIDILTAKNAVLFPIGVLWGFRDRADLLDAGAHCLVEQPQEIFALLHNK